MAEVKELDPRKMEDLFRAFENADFIVRKRYRSDLEQYSICDVPDWLTQAIPSVNESGKTTHQLGDNIQLVKVEKLIYDKKENLSDKLTTVYHTMSSFENTSVIMLVVSDGKSADLYLGVAERLENGKIDINARGNKLATLKTSFEANFPGSFINEFENDTPIDKKAVIEKTFADVQAVSCVTGVASLRNKEAKANDEFVQGMEKLFDAMYGKRFSAVFIADCKGINEIESLCTSYEDIHSKLSPFAQSQQTIGKTDGVTDTESFIEGVTNTTNESVSDTLSHSHTVGTTKTNSFGVTVDAGKFLGKIPFVGKYLGAAFSGVSANYSHSTAKNDADTDTDAKTKTTGTAQSLTKQNSVAKSLSTTTNDGLQISIQNRAVKTLLDRIDEQIKHLRACESFGVFDFSCYFLAQESAVSKAAASVYDSLMRGEESGAEVSAVNTWRDENAKKAIEYLSRFYHPLVAVPNLSKPEVNDKGIPTGLYNILPVTPSTIISGKEISLHMGLPKKSVAGIPVTESADFGRNIISLDNANIEGLQLGNIFHMQKSEDTPVELDANSLTMHTFITGSTGSGKSNTVYQILNQLPPYSATFLVVEPAKGEYKNIFGHRKDVAVYGTNPRLTELLRLNPFSFPPEIHIYEHMDRLVEIFNVCWPMYAAMPAVLKDAIERAYIAAGWNLKSSENRYSENLFPTFADVLREIDSVMDESQYSADSKGDYKGALSTRLRSLTNGINGMIFGADELSPAELFDNNVIVDLSRVGSTETKSMIMGLLVMKLQEYRMSKSKMNQSLKHITVLEEAHNLLKRTSTEQSSEGSNLVGKSVEMLTNAIAEMRTYGEGFIIADQAPGLLDMAVIRNTNTKIILRLPEHSDRELVGKAIGLDDDQIDELARLKRGVAAVCQNDWIEAVLCEIERFESKKTQSEETQSEETQYISASKHNDISEIVANVVFETLVHYRELDAHKKLSEKIEWLDRNILLANVPAKLKCEILKFSANAKTNDFEGISHIAYELFNVEEVFSQANKFDDPQKWMQYVRASIEPSIGRIADKEMSVLLAMFACAESAQHPEHQEQIRKLCRRDKTI